MNRCCPVRGGSRPTSSPSGGGSPALLCRCDRETLGCSPVRPYPFALSQNRWYSFDVNTERIRQKLSNGFRPFALHLSGGKRYVVPHPEFIMVGRNVVAVMGKDDSVT